MREKEREEREGERDESLAGWSGGSSAVPSGPRPVPSAYVLKGLIENQ